MELPPILKALEDHVSCGRFKLFSWFKCDSKRYEWDSDGSLATCALRFGVLAPIFFSSFHRVIFYGKESVWSRVEASNGSHGTRQQQTTTMSADHPTMANSLQLSVQTLSNPTTSITKVLATGDGARGEYSALICSVQSPPRLPQGWAMGRGDGSPPNATIGPREASKLHETNTTINRNADRRHVGWERINNTPQSAGMWGLLYVNHNNFSCITFDYV